MAYQIGWFSTGRGLGSMNLLHAIVKAVREGEVPGRLSFVFCSRVHGEAEGSDRYIGQVHDYGIPLVCFSSKKFEPDLRLKGMRDPDAMKRWRIAYDREVMKRLEGLHADIIVLAGYMLIAGEEMCERYDMINLHPALPGGPTGTWQQVIWQLIAKRAEQSGNMMHLVTRELDKGPAVTYCSFSLRRDDFGPLWQDMEKKLAEKPLSAIIGEEKEQNPLFLKIREESAKRELPLVVQTVKAFAEGRIRLEGKKIIADGTILNKPFCLNKEIEKQLQAQ